MQGNMVGNFLGVLGTALLVTIVLSNYKGVAGILGGLGNLYTSAAKASVGTAK